MLQMLSKLLPPTLPPQTPGEGLTPEEDWVVRWRSCIMQLIPHHNTQVPGGYEDSLSSNTELGRAVRAACSELDTLSQLVRAVVRLPPAACTLPTGGGDAHAG